MVCGACKAPVAAGSTSCPSCGRKFKARPALPPPQEIDLAPEAPAAVQTRRPPVPLPLPRQRRAGTPFKSRGTASKATLGGIISVLIACGWVGLRACSVYRSINGETVANTILSVPAKEPVVRGLNVDGNFRYTFSVTALDGEVGMFVIRVKGKDSLSPEEKLSLLKSLTLVEQGKSHTMTGQFSTGDYAWGLINPEDSGSVRVKVDFSAK